MLETIATICFGLAVLHTFLTKRFQKIGSQYPQGSILENLFHLLGEVEVVFGLWAFVYISALAIFDSPANAIHYLENRNFTEPAFVFVIMVVCGSKPILILAEKLIDVAAKILPLDRSHITQN